MIGLQMDWNRRSFRIISGLLFVCLSLETTIVIAKPFRANRTDAFSHSEQSPSRVTIGSSALQAFNDRYDKNSNHFSRKKSPKSDVTSDSDTYQEESDSNSGDSRDSDWSLQFDPNYFASLNAANHRPIDAMIASPTDSQTKHTMTSSSSASNYSPSSSSSSSPSSSSPENTYYYSPETYGKTSHKNHKTGSFAYLYPSSSSTTTTTTTSTTPTPKTSHNRFGELSGGSSANTYSEPAPLYPSKYESNDKQSYNYDESPEGEEEEASYYDTNEEIGRKSYYYPTRSRPKKYPIHSAPDYYGTDLSSMPSSNDKVKSAINSPIASYGTQEETDVGHNVATYESGGKVMFPTRPYGGGGGGGGGGYPYPSPSSYYPHPYYSSSASEHSYSGGDSLLHKSSNWLGPGIAGLLLGILPLGLLMASMVPAFMSVPIVSTATVGRKKRFADFGLLNFNDTNVFLNPGVIDIIGKYGITSLEDSNCLMEMLCMFASEGKKSNRNLVQNIFYHIIDWTPDRWAEWLSVDRLFKAVKRSRCEPTYRCMTRKVKLKDEQKYSH